MKQMLLKKLTVAALIAVFVSSVGAIGAVPVAAATPVKAVEVSEVEFQPFADVLQTHLAWINGVLHFRIWNATRGRWEGSWTPV